MARVVGDVNTVSSIGTFVLSTLTIFFFFGGGGGGLWYNICHSNNIYENTIFL